MIADDHPIVRQGLRAVLEREGIVIVAEAADGLEAVRAVAEQRPEVAILDISMPQLNGLEATREIRKVSPTTDSILLTVHADPSYVLEAVEAGARGYLLKSQAGTELTQGVREVAGGSVYLGTGVARVVVEAYLTNRQVAPDPLSARERQVLQLIAEGNTTKEIAQILGVSVKTAESHRGRLMEKLEIHETASLVRYAIRRGIVQA